MEKIEEVERFTNQVPNVLLDDIILSLGSQFLSNTIGVPETKRRPSLCSTKRFHASLLFVDISGFTVLSQRLPVDEFKSHINNYFTKILDIVDKFNGCVVKFAGDALFIIWPSVPEAQDEIDGVEEQEARKVAMKQAVRCGVEILEKCSNHRIDFSHHHNTNFDSISSLVLSPIHREHMDSSNHHKDDHCFLNVHAGAAEGVLVSMDIGHANRWEYFILGQPILDVADAEAVANKGELVISPSAHHILCGGGFTGTLASISEQRGGNGGGRENESDESPPPNNRGMNLLEDSASIEDNNMQATSSLPCGCMQTSNGCYLVNLAHFTASTEEAASHRHHHSSIRATNRASSKHRLQTTNEDGNQEDNNDVSFPHYESMIAKVNAVFESNKELMISEYKLLLVDADNKQHDTDILIEDMLYAQFSHWAIACFADDIARHVHEADRSSFQFVDLPRQDQIKALLAIKKPTAGAVNHSRDAGSFVARIRHLSRSSMEMRGRSTSISLSDSSQPQTQQAQSETSVSVHRGNENGGGGGGGGGGLSGELRKVIVMFINLKSSSHALTFDQHADTTRDEQLLCKFQSCIEVLITALHETGGQLRQFIVDDKGTVAIGSFGLRGSSNYDNAAAAVEAAQRIIDGLQLIGVDCGVGLTSGRAYCGLVGSTKRNEYAIMGPSTNLSARLMGKANMGEILCDEAIKDSDRSHHFIAYGTVAAKGYAAPVAIFKPDFSRGDSNEQDDNSPSRDRAQQRHRNGIVIAPDSSKNHHSSSKGNLFRSDSTNAPSLQANIAILQAATADIALDTPGNPNNRLTRTSAAQAIGGREYELQETYDFLAMSFVTSEEAREPLVNFLTNPFTIDSDHSLVFDEEHGLTSLTRMAVFEGESGIGKTTILRTVKRAFVRLSKRPEAAITIVHARSSSYRAWDPFIAIKPIIRKLLMHLAPLNSNASNNNSSKTVPAVKSLQIDPKQKLSSQDKLVFEGIDYLATLLNDDVKSLLPLFTSANIIKGIPENEITGHYEGEIKLHKCEDLFITFFNVFVDCMHTKVMIFFDDSQFMDNYSWRLVEKIWMACSGVIIVTTYFARGEESSMVKRGFCGDAAVLKATHRVLKISLQSLSSDAVKNIAQGYFLARGLDEVDDEVYTKIDEFSGGNPLYVQEITKAIIDKSESKIVEINDYQKGGVDAEKMAEQICSNQNFFREILQTFNSNYLEEIIYYRFDKLSVAQQMVLKVAAVISEDAGDFSFSYLLALFMQNAGITDSLYANQYSVKDQASASFLTLKLDVLLAKTLHHILDMHEFITNVDNSHRSSSSSLSSDGHIHSSNKLVLKTDEDILLDMQHYTFAFKVPLERKAIEDLLLEEQKLLMHEQAGHWLADRNHSKGEFVSARDVHSEAQHWEQAKQWPQALTAYHKAGMIVHRAGGTVDAIQIMASSYRMLTLLQEEAGVTDRLDYGDVTFDMIYDQVKIEAENGFITHCPEGYWDKKMLMYQIFRGDSALLEETIEMVAHFGQMSAVHITNRDIVLRLYDLVMAIIVLSRRRPNFPEGLKESCPQLEDFGHKDYPSFFAVLFGYVLVAQFAGIPDLKTERTIGNIIILAASVRAHTSAPSAAALVPSASSPAAHQASVEKDRLLDRIDYHKLVGWSILNSVAIAEGKLDEFIETGEAMIKLYNPKVHSTLLISSYGADMIPFSIARYGQRLWGSGLFLRANEVMDYAIQRVKEVTHVMSLAKLSIFLTSLFTLQSRYTLAMEVFTHYVDTDDMLGGHSLYKIIHPLYFEWCKSKSKAGIPVTAYEPMCELQEKIAKGSYLAGEQRARPIIFDALAMYGAGIEMPCADILMTKANQWLEYVASKNAAQHSEEDDMILHEVEAILLIALDYTERGLVMYDNDVLYPTPYIGLRKLKLYTQHTLYRCYTMMDNTDKAIESQAKSVQSIQVSIDLIKQLHFPFFLVMMGNYIKQENFDSELGKVTIKEGLRRIVENNTKEDRLPALQFLAKALPQLTNCVETWLAEHEAAESSSPSAETKQAILN